MIYGYASLQMAKSFYIIGGSDGGSSKSTIAQFDTTTLVWSLVGKFNTGRKSHGAIQQNLKLLVVGGRLPVSLNNFLFFFISGNFAEGCQCGPTGCDCNDIKTEVCRLVSGNFQCTDQAGSLSGYSPWPMLFFVNESYEKCADRSS